MEKYKCMYIFACILNQFPTSADPDLYHPSIFQKYLFQLKMLKRSIICALNRESTSNHKNKITFTTFSTFAE